jgi:hypothetical protein
MGTDSREDPVASSCDCGNEPLDFIKAWNSYALPERLSFTEDELCSNNTVTMMILTEPQN